MIYVSNSFTFMMYSWTSNYKCVTFLHTVIMLTLWNSWNITTFMTYFSMTQCNDIIFKDTLDDTSMAYTTMTHFSITHTWIPHTPIPHMNTTYTNNKSIPQTPITIHDCYSFTFPHTLITVLQFIPDHVCVHDSRTECRLHLDPSIRKVAARLFLADALTGNQKVRYWPWLWIKPASGLKEKS